MKEREGGKEGGRERGREGGRKGERERERERIQGYSRVYAFTLESRPALILSLFSSVSFGGPSLFSVLKSFYKIK